MRYSKYPSYRDSGTDWLGNVPDEWHIVRNKQAFSFEKDLVGKKSKDYTLLSLTLRGIKVRDIESGKGKFPAEFDTYQKVEKDDIIFCLFDIDETPRTVGLSKHSGMITGAYNVARCNTKALPTYMYYYYLSIDEYKGLKPYYTGLRKVVRTETFMNIQLALPSYKEQQTIANYLDNATAKIDTLIEKQTKLIELLKEKRQAVISTAVTRGLDPSVPMKDSGVEWLGEIPEHWTLPKISYTSSVTNGSTPDKSNKEYWTNGTIPWLASGCLNIDKVVEPTGLISNNAYNSCSVEIIPSGSLLLGMVGQGKTRGTSALLGIDACINQNLAAIIPTDKIQVQFLHFLFQAMYVSLREAGRGSNQAALNCDIIKSIRIPFPAIHEQEEISEYINDKTKKIDNLTAKATQAIDLLKEKRTALISAVVTGKIYVRSF